MALMGENASFVLAMSGMGLAFIGVVVDGSGVGSGDGLFIIGTALVVAPIVNLATELAKSLDRRW